MSGFGISTAGGTTPSPVPETVITFNQLTPTTSGVVFDPDEPNNTDVIYSSDIDASSWRWTGSAYITYNVPSTTAWNIYGTTTDAGGNKTSAISRGNSVYAPNFGNKIGFTGSGLPGYVGNWYNVFHIRVYGAFEQLAFTIIMNERGAGSGGGSHVKLDFIVKIQGTTFKSIVVNCTTSSYLNTFDLSNFQVLWNNTDKRFTVYYKPTVSNMSTAWTVINSDKSNMSNSSYIIWNNTYLATSSLAGQVNDPINNKRITLNQINGAYSLPVEDGTANQVMQTNGAGITSWATAGGLTNFVEALTTTAPNTTVHVDSITALASTTNADFVIAPKGTGALLAQIPDNTSAGGNKRGTNAVDWQRVRVYNPNEVASGGSSAIIGGYGNKATAYASTVLGGGLNTSSGESSISGGYGNVAGGFACMSIGYQNNASGNGSVAFGSLNIVSNEQSVAIGNGNNVSGVVSAAIGASNIVSGSGYYSAAIGLQNNVSAYSSYAFGLLNNITGGYGSTAFGFKASNSGMICKASFGASVYGVGATQSAITTFDRRTTDATASVLVIDSGNSATPAADNQFVLPNNSLMRIKGSIQGKQSGSVNCAVWDIDAVLVRGTSAGTFAIVGTPTVTLITNVPAWGTPTLTANTTIGCLTATVIGATATNIQWAMNINSVETIYA